MRWDSIIKKLLCAVHKGCDYTRYVRARILCIVLQLEGMVAFVDSDSWESIVLLVRCVLSCMICIYELMVLHKMIMCFNNESKDVEL